MYIIIIITTQIPLHTYTHSISVNWNNLRTSEGFGGVGGGAAGGVENLLAVVDFKQMCLQSSFKCSGWLNV